MVQIPKRSAAAMLARALAVLAGAGVAGCGPAGDTAEPVVVELRTEGSRTAFLPDTASAAPGARVTLRMVNEGEIAHNLVVVADEESVQPIVLAAYQSIATEYVPTGFDEAIVASTPLAYPGDDPTSPEAVWCLEQYFEELDARFEEGFDTRLSLVTGADGCLPPGGAFVVATIDGRPVACGGLKVVGGDTAYLKRMWVDATVRGLGLGRRLLDALEREARSLGCRRVQLETNRALTEAIRMYETSGYRRVDAFNDERYADHWFEKDLTAGDSGPEARP